MRAIPVSPLVADEGVLELLRWFAKTARDLPWRRTTDPYAIWVSEIMLQQTQVRTATAYWERWMTQLPDIRSLAAAPEETVLKLWEGLGYYSRARNLQKAARHLVDAHDGVFPTDPTSILRLPGIGPYTAGAIGSVAFDLPTPILDGNVIRVLTRALAIPGDPRSKPVRDPLWAVAGKLVALASRLEPRHVPRPPRPITLAGNCSQFNQALMELGALICTPTSPRCGECPWANRCLALQAGAVEAFPQTAPRVPSQARHLATALWEHRGRWLMARRPDGGVNQGLWEFPNIEVASADRDAARHALARWLQVDPASLADAGVLRNSITRYRFHQHLFRVSGNPSSRSSLPSQCRWTSAAELTTLPMNGPHRKLANRLLPH